MKEQKELGKNDFSRFPAEPGDQTRLHLVHDGGVRKGRITINRFVELTSVAGQDLRPVPQKGTIAPGSDADM
jgi:dihydropyrimidinase